MRPIVTTVLLCLLKGAVYAQGHGPHDTDPSGVVVDEQLRPLAGATVRLVAQVPSGQFTRAVDGSLAGTPLPTTRSRQDGGWVLPLTEAMRRIEVEPRSSSGLWLVVERDGYLPWREPLPHGLAHWLGSRVILRAIHPADPFANLPWPPAAIDHATQAGFWPWIAIDGSEFPRGPQPLPATTKRLEEPEPVALTIRVLASENPVADATLWFDDDAVGLESSDPLCARTDMRGTVRIMVRGGRDQRRIVRVIAPGFVALSESVPADGDRKIVLRLEPAHFVDVLAIDADDKPVPFAKLAFVPLPPRGDLLPFTRFADACGRARIPVATPAAWVVYGDRGARAPRVELGHADSDGIVRVPHRQAVTIRLRGDDWPKSGNLWWHTADGGRVGRAFAIAAPIADFAVLRLVHRDDVQLEIGGDERPSFVIRRSDLPPPPTEPLLDLVDIDRRVRVRAKLEPSSSHGALQHFVVRPPWQLSAPQRGDAIHFTQQTSEGWLLRLRDDGPHDLMAVASGHTPLMFRVPAATPGGTMPTVPLQLEPK